MEITVIVFECDRCGKQLTPKEAQPPSVIEPNLGTFVIPESYGFTAIPGKRVVGILCASCHQGLIEWWNSLPAIADRRRAVPPAAPAT